LWRGSVKRMLLGCAIVLMCATAGAAVAVLEQVHNIRDALNQNAALKTGGTLASAGWGDPQTLLLVGDDTRKEFKYYRGYVPDLANEMLLVRLDPSKPYISMMSIPRELRVTIYPPSRRPYTDRLNSAYTFGISTLVSTLKRALGAQVNHVVVITFARFERAVNQMGCVYSTVDRRYFHVNVPGGEQYQEINLQPGYQKMCGTQAEQFVSYRHGDTSLIRDARDQSFLLDVKKQYGPTLVDNVGKFERIFGQAVLTDPGLHSTNGILNLLGTLVNASSLRVRQVQFQATLLPSYDTATPRQIHASMHAFLFGGSPIPKGSTAAVAHAVHRGKVAATLPLVATGPGQAAQARSIGAGLPFPLEYPRVQERAGASIPPFLRAYMIHGSGNTAYPIYTAVFYQGQLGQYYNVQGTDWTDAPQFSSPDQTVHVSGRTYNLYYEASKLKMVAWFEHGAAYWIRNSLNDAVPNGEMLAIAEQTTAVTSAAGGRVRLKGAGVPAELTPKKPTSTRETIGSIAGLLTLLLVPVLAFLGLRHRRRLSGVREVLETGLERGARLPVVPFEPGSAAARSAERTRLAADHPAPPSVAVAVLAVGTDAAAAERLAEQLRGRSVPVGTVGTISGAPAGGLQILYEPGYERHAGMLERLLAGRDPTVEPLDSGVAAAAGGAQLVVVIA
jgi:polyisoprenyl-teichoic acid--peptidoglycan teichoic acid transferase